MAAKLFITAIICFAVYSPFTSAHLKREAPFPPSSNNIQPNRNAAANPNNGYEFLDPRNLYYNDNDARNGRISPDGLLNLARRGRAQNMVNPEEYIRRQPHYNQPWYPKVHHHIHYTPRDIIKINQILSQGKPYTDLFNFADNEDVKTTEKNPADQVIFGDNCPVGYTKIADKCFKEDK